jgi:hypothetical protein
MRLREACENGFRPHPFSYELLSEPYFLSLCR